MEKISDLIGLNVFYKNTNFIIKSVKKVSNTIVVFTTGRTYNFLPSEVQQFLNDIKIMENNNKPDTQNNALSNEDKIKQILFDTLSRVRNDKDYIPQANAICNVVSQLINVKKIEMQLNKR